jgi:superfamily II RNA helicase
LLVGEAIKNGLFQEIDLKSAAGLMASLASDPDRDYGNLRLSDPLMDAVASLEDIIYEVSRVEWRFGVDPIEEINLSAAAAAESWAGGSSWTDLARRTRADEGDLVRLLSRTGEALMQIAHLKDSNAKAAALARDTAEAILREPVR